MTVSPTPPAVLIAGQEAGTSGLVSRHWRRAIVALVCLLLAGVIVPDLARSIRPDRGLLDLASFLHSGNSYREGLNPYGLNPGVSPAPLDKSLNLNPPISVYVFSLAGRFDPSTLRLVLFVASLAAYAGVVYALAREFPAHRRALTLLAVFSLAGLWYTLEYGQIYVALVAAAAGAYLLLRRSRWFLPGLLLGLMTALKPQFALVALLLIAARHRRPAFFALGTAALISLIPLLIDGPAIYRQWLSTLRDFDGLLWPGNASLVALGGRLGSEALGWALVALLVVSLTVWALRASPEAPSLLNVALIAVVLAGPTSWPGYTPLLLPLLFSRRWDAPVWLALSLMCVPQVLVINLTHQNAVTQVVIGSINVWAMLLMLRTAVVDAAVEKVAVEERPEAQIALASLESA